MIYLASPYNHPEYTVRQERYDKVRDIVWNSLPQTVYFSPILYCHNMAIELGLPLDHRPYEALNTMFLRHCDAMHILCLEGWDASAGVAYERHLANTLNIPVSFLEPPK